MGSQSWKKLSLEEAKAWNGVGRVRILREKVKMDRRADINPHYEVCVAGKFMGEVNVNLDMI